jgi:GAF domain-containing protein
VPLCLPVVGGGEPGEEREQVVGLLSITAFFEQKPAWADLDRELLDLLSKNAAAALLAAALYADAEHRAEAEGSPFDPRATLARLAAGGAERSD